MSFEEIVNLSSDDDEHGEVDVKPIKSELSCIGDSRKPKGCHASQSKEDKKSNAQQRRQKSEENRSSSTLSADQSSVSMLEQGQSPVDDTSLSPSTTIHPAPLCRQFWKAGSYKDDLGSKATRQNGKNYLHVHPMFLHSNATSHKWAFGAIAELLDNSFDEIQNGATFVIVDKTSNPRDGKEALLIQDDGGGMDVEAMRRCMSFGFSDKKAKSSIGRYGNGFKTSTMRLGADVIVFSRCLNDGVLSQSIGLLSYTFLSRTGHDRIVVPMVNYAFNTSTGTLEHQNSREHFTSNLSMLLKWSPFSTEAELLKQFNDVGQHGTKVIVYNLWLTNEGKVELDFDTDPEDIRIGGDSKKIVNPLHEQHIANRLQFSLREYLSILYLRMPQNFSIKLRGRVVEHRIIANDLKYPEFILYKPQSGGCKEGEVITTIGFIKEAPQVNVHGFNVYHKNRLVLPFWQVVSYSDNRGRGVVGVLEANFIEPSHNKQDFERTSLFQKLENRLKEMTWEYWDYHCGLIGYLPKKKLQAPIVTSHSTHLNGSDYGTTKIASIGNRFQHTPVPNSHGISKQGLSGMKRKELDDSTEVQMVKNQAWKGANPVAVEQNQPKVDQEAANLLQKNKTLRAKCSEYEQKEKELNSKVAELRGEIAKFEKEYTRLLAAMLG